MLASILIASFVVVCTLTTMALSIHAIRAERVMRAELDHLDGWLDEHAWPRMDVPKKYPAIRTRSAKALR